MGLTKPVLQGESITMRPMVAGDAEVVFASLADKEVAYLTGTNTAFTWEQVQAHCASALGADDRADYVIVLQSDPARVVGEAVINEIDAANRSGSFRIALFSKAYFGKGYGTQATRVMMRYAFETLDLHRLELEVYDHNPRARHVYEKLGFVHEGVRRDALCWQGAYHDAIVMSVLQPDYVVTLQKQP